MDIDYFVYIECALDHAFTLPFASQKRIYFILYHSLYFQFLYIPIYASKPIVSPRNWLAVSLTTQLEN